MNALNPIRLPKSFSPLKRFLTILLFLAAIAFWTWPFLQITDSHKYFKFADDRTFWGIQNAMDVLSNLIFIFFGLQGVRNVLNSSYASSSGLFFCGLSLAGAVFFTGLGSAYFHWNPTPETLVWDRLPMTIGFSSIVALTVADRINEKIGLWLLIFLVPFGLFTIVGFAQEWITLRPYVALQAGSILFIVLLISTHKENKITNSSLWLAIFLYVAAKFFERYDLGIFELTGIISGHTLKHLFAGLAIYKLLSFYKVAAKP